MCVNVLQPHIYGRDSLISFAELAKTLVSHRRPGLLQPRMHVRMLVAKHSCRNEEATCLDR